MAIKRKAYVSRGECVACGCCVKVCPLGAIRGGSGLYADVDASKCVGCKKCAVEYRASLTEIGENESGEASA